MSLVSIDNFLMKIFMLSALFVFTVAKQTDDLCYHFVKLLDHMTIVNLAIPQGPRRRKFRLRFSSPHRTYGHSPSVDVNINIPMALMVLSAIMITGCAVWSFTPYWAQESQVLRRHWHHSFDPLHFAKPPDLPQPFQRLPGTKFVVAPDPPPFPIWLTSRLDSWLHPTASGPRSKTRGSTGIPHHSHPKSITKNILRQTLRTAKSATEALDVLHSMAMAAKLPTAPHHCFFDSDSVQMIVDNGSSVTLWKHRSSFTDLVPLTDEEKRAHGIKGISGMVYPEGKGTLAFTITDDNGNPHLLSIQDALFVPTCPYNLFCPQQWVQQRRDLHADPTAHVDTRADEVILEWSGPAVPDHRPPLHRRRVPINCHSNIFTMDTHPGFSSYLSHANVTCFGKHVCMAGPHVIPDDSSSIGASSHDSSTCHPSQPPESEGDLNILRDAPVTTDFSKPSGHTVIP